MSPSTVKEPVARVGAGAGRKPGPDLTRASLRATALLYLGLFVLVPSAAVMMRGFSNGMTNLTEAMSAFGAWNAIRLTVTLAAITAIVNGIFGTLLAYVLVRMNFPGRGFVSALIDLPFAVPSLVTGVMLVALYGPSSIVGSFFQDAGV